MSLPPVACQILCCLDDQAGLIAPLESLCQTGPYPVSAVYHAIRLLRAVIEPYPARPQYLLTHRGQGAVLTPYHYRCHKI